MMYMLVFSDVVPVDATILLLQIRSIAIQPFYFKFSGVEFLFQYFLCIEQKFISMDSSHNQQRDSSHNLQRDSSHNLYTLATASKCEY